eukprot:Gb_09133 [translate_table: standard]
MGPENRELKLWVPFDSACLVPPAPIGKWKCIETVELKNSMERRPCQLFFNRTLRDSEASLLVVGSTQDNSIYVVHVEFEAHSAYMDYLSKFCVELPISNLTARSDSSGDGEGVVEIFCVHDESIQLYTLYRSQCIPPVHNGSSGASSPKECYGQQELDISDPSGLCSAEIDYCYTLSPEGKAEPLSPVGRNSDYVAGPSASAGFGSWIEIPGSLDFLKPRDVRGTQTAEYVLQEQKTAGLSQINLNVIAASGFQTETVPDLRSQDFQKGIKYCPVSSLGKLPETMPVTNFITCTIPSLSVGQNSHELGISDGNRELKIHTSTNSKKFNDESSHDLSKESSIRDNNNLHARVSICTSATNQSFKDEITTALSFALSDGENTNVRTHELPPESNNWSVSSGLLSSEDTATSFQLGRDEIEISKSIVDMVKNESSPSSDWEHIDTRCTAGNHSLPLVLEESMDGREMGPDQIHGVDILTSSSAMNNSFPEGLTSRQNAFQTWSVCTSLVQASLNALVNMQEEFQKHISVAVEISMSEESSRLESSIVESLERYLETYADAVQSGFREETTGSGSMQDSIHHLVPPFSKNDLPSALYQTISKEISYLGPAIARSITSSSDRMITAIASNMSQVKLVCVIASFHLCSAPSYFPSMP